MNAKFKAGVDKTVEECEEIIRNLKSGYPGLTSWKEVTKNIAARKVYTETWLGRRRYLSNQVQPQGSVYDERGILFL